jgi:hypothetical protein
MDYTILVNLLWDVATGVTIVLVAYGAWLCLAYRETIDEIEKTKKPHFVCMHVSLN